MATDKEFEELYRAAGRLAAACHGKGENGEGPYQALRNLDRALANASVVLDERTGREASLEPTEANPVTLADHESVAKHLAYRNGLRRSDPSGTPWDTLGDAQALLDRAAGKGD